MPASYANARPMSAGLVRRAPAPAVRATLDDDGRVVAASGARQRPKSALDRPTQQRTPIATSGAGLDVKTSLAAEARSSGHPARPRSALAGRTSKLHLKDVVGAATREVYDLCEQLRLPEVVVAELATAAADPHVAGSVVNELRDHRTMTLQALRRIDARERILRCLDDLRFEEGTSTPRTRTRRMAEVSAVHSALETSNAAVEEAVVEWQQHRTRFFSQGHGGQNAAARGDDLVFKWEGVDYLAKLRAESTLIGSRMMTPISDDTMGSKLAWPTVVHTATMHAPGGSWAANSGVLTRSSISPTFDPVAEQTPTELSATRSRHGSMHQLTRSGSSSVLDKRVAAARIQSWFRVCMAKSKLLVRRLYRLAVRTIVRYYRRWKRRRQLRRTVVTHRQLTVRERLENEALAKDHWRRLAARRLQRFLTGLVVSTKASRAAQRLEAQRAAAVQVVRRFVERTSVANYARNIRRRRICLTLIQCFCRCELSARMVNDRVQALIPSEFDNIAPVEVESLPALITADAIVYIDDASVAEIATSATAARVIAETISPTRGRVVVEPTAIESFAATPIEKTPLQSSIRASTSLEGQSEPVPCAAVRPPYAVKYRRAVLLMGNGILPYFDDRDERPSTVPRTFWAGDYEAAVAIQATFRGMLGRRRARHRAFVARCAAEDAANQARRHQLATVLQAACRAVLSQRWCTKKPSLRKSSARRLQRWWRDLLHSGRVGTAARHAHEDDVLLVTSLRPRYGDDQERRDAIRRRAAVREVEAWWMGLRAKWDFRLARQSRAAIPIQRAWRNFVCLRVYLNAKARRRAAELEKLDATEAQIRKLAALQQLAALETEEAAWQSFHDGALSRIEHVNAEIRRRPDRNVAATRVQCGWRSAVARQRRKQLVLERLHSWAHAAIRERQEEYATRIQAWWRGVQWRYLLSDHRQRSQDNQARAAVVLQSFARGTAVRQRVVDGRLRSSAQYAEAQRLREKLGLPALSV